VGLHLVKSRFNQQTHWKMLEVASIRELILTHKRCKSHSCRIKQININFLVERYSLSFLSNAAEKSRESNFPSQAETSLPGLTSEVHHYIVLHLENESLRLRLGL
jgi:hypothetical protein